MKTQFRHYRRPTAAEFDALWERAIIVLDANVLLNAYRYSDATRRQLLQLLRRLRKRLWIPHQAALEFHRARPEVMFDRRNAFRGVRETVEESRKTLQEKLSALYRDAAVDTKALMAGLEEAHGKLLHEVEALEKQAVEPTAAVENDVIWRAVLDLFDGRTGNPYDEEAYAELCKVAQSRFSAGRPPGFADEKKGGTEQYGDYILWRQMLDHAKATSSPMVLVTDDRKEDWWLKSHGSTIGPLPELVAEMHQEAGVDFYMYQPDQFMTFASERFKTDVSPETLQEVRSLPSRTQHVHSPTSVEPPDLDAMWRSVRRTRASLLRRISEARHELARVESLSGGHLRPDQAAYLQERRHDLLRELAMLERRMLDHERIGETLRHGGAGRPGSRPVRATQTEWTSEGEQEQLPEFADDRDAES